MTRKFSTLALFVLVGCGSPPPADQPSPTPEPAPEPAPLASTEPTKPEPAPEPTPEEKKKAEDAKKLVEDRKKMVAEHETEVARWTPELRAEAKTLAEKTYPTGRAAIQAVLAGKHRQPGNPERDGARHPKEMLELFGFKPTQTVLEYGPGEGWYTELLAPALAAKGKLIVTNTDPKGPVTERSTFYGERLQRFLDTSPEVYGKVQQIVIDPKAPKLGLDGTVDLVLLFRGMHGMNNNKVLDAWLGEFHKALKPKGILGVEQHRAKADADVEKSSKQGYLPEKWVIEAVEKAGFKLVQKSEINANKKDTTDHPEGVWTLPPTLRLGDKDREKYVAIGESDRMTLKFVKIEKK
jgi:predicted methyltransferase